MIDSLSFENLIIWCCSADESELRVQIKSALARYDFTYIEDDYLSYRNIYEEKIPNIHNLLFTRGSPKYCLVAHTDVCRDHSTHQSNSDRLIPNPVLKFKDARRIIQDKDCKVQVGGDDRLGVAIALWVAFNNINYDIAILLTTDEEVGLVSAKEVKFEALKNFDLLIQIDRGNQSNQIVSKIRDLELCDKELAEKLASRNSRELVSGYPTDVFAIKKNLRCKNAINITCGYHDSHGDSGLEYIDVDEAIQTINFINSVTFS
jgi:hypothetical protein